MAIITNKLSGEEIILHCQHFIGRDRNNITCIEDKDVSRKHAVIYWENNYWYLTDFSSNGTKVNNAHIHHTTTILERNNLIQFSNTEKGIWKLINLDCPNSFFKAVHTISEFIDLGKGIVLLEEKNNKWIFFRSKDQNWIMDDSETETILIHGEIYLINGIEYEFIENEYSVNTRKNIDITNNACFIFSMSVDEENVSSKIKINDLVLDLGIRVYNHLLLQLVKIKQQDLQSGLNEKICGWIYIEELSEILSKELQLDVDMYYINILIYRLRKSLMRLSPYGYLFAHIIERQKGKLRFGFSNFEIDKEQIFA